MRVIARGRQAGKTYDLIQWVKNGEKTNSYPGWSRVLLCHSLEEAQRIRIQYDVDYRQVFAVSEWRSARLGPLPVQIAVDNVDLVLAMHLGLYGITQIAVTGSAE